VCYLIGSHVIYHHTLYIVEKVIPVEKVPTKCKLQNLGPGYNLYVVKSAVQPDKSAFVWECQLDRENKVADKKEETATLSGS
jgi:hypothetical protein